jgi:outer membrane protein OmpA-like peptidoglycan-associated protein
MNRAGLIAAILLFAASCVAQTNTAPDQNSLTQPRQDEFGRPVQPVGNPVPQVQPVAPTDRQSFEQNVKDVYFDFNRANLTPDDHATLQHDAEWLKAHPEVTLTIEGHADPRGDISYNLFLSDTRALAARDELIKAGVPEKQILFATGWGKLYPVCQQDDESCWSQERRAHFAPWTAGAGPTTTAQTERIHHDVMVAGSSAKLQ